VCPYCESGFEQYCPNKERIGYDRPGALAEYVSLPVTPLCELPDGVSDAVASALLCLHDTPLATGATVAIIGTGVMGNQYGQLARLFGTGRVFAVDIVPEKLELAEKQGMIPINVQIDDPIARIYEATGIHHT
jgi:threonine dehydrogenase-like Zn-dependent dehydrogenase